MSHAPDQPSATLARPVDGGAAGPATRRAALRELVKARELDALLVTDLVNVRYLTGFTGSNAVLLLAADGADLLGTDGRYRLQAAAEAPDLELLVERATATAVAARATGRLGFESDAVSVEVADALAKAAGRAELARAPGLVQRLRLVKDAGELATLRRACTLGDDALATLLGSGAIREGRTEREIALDLQAAMVRLGADDRAFEPIVAAGPNSAIPHHRPTDAPVRRGDLLKLDFGALVGGYHSDMTRTFVLGPAAAWQRELYALVRQAQAAGCAAVADGAEVTAVDHAARQVIAGAGHAGQFVHGLGHGVGLQIHEAPWLSPTGQGTLAAGMTVTVEPGVYLPGRGGVRIEDTLLVGPGDAQPLSRSPRDELLEL